MDIQMTDYENIALTVMTGMIANIVNTFDVDFVLPISMVDKNMDTAHIKDALTEKKFWFKTSILPTGAVVENKLQETNFVKSNNSISRS